MEKLKEIQFSKEARRKLMEGIDILNNAVKVTLGPKGRNVIISNGQGKYYLTKDGVSVAKSIKLKDVYNNIGVSLIKEVAAKTCEDAGDGTTTSTILAHAILEKGLPLIDGNKNPVEIKKGMDHAVKLVTDQIKRKAIPIGDNSALIKNVATISANNDEYIGGLISEAFEKVTKDGIITVQDSNNTNTFINVVEGTKLDKGFTSPNFITNNIKQTCELENPLVLIYGKKISLVNDIIGILQEISKTGRSLLIIAEEVNNEAFNTIMINTLQGKLKVCIINAPGFGEMRDEILEDIAVLTNGIHIKEELGYKLEKVTCSMLGSADKIIINKDSTLIVGGAGSQEKINKRVEVLRLLASHNTEIAHFYLERIAKLLGGIAVLNVGAGSEIELKEKKDRIEDALSATNAAIKEGILPGGGSFYLRAQSLLHEEAKKYKGDFCNGIKLIELCLAYPLRQILLNAGLTEDKIAKIEFDLAFPNIEELNIRISENYEYYIGFDAKTMEICNLYERGIIDPAKVTRVALENAVSVAGMILTTECIMLNDYDVQKMLEN